MDDALPYTLSEMYRVAREYATDLRPYALTNVRDAFDLVRALPYVPDDSTGYPEALKRPAYTLEAGGDCDDKAIALGAALNLLNVPWRFVTSSARPDGDQDHVYLEVYDGNVWRPADATFPGNQYGRAPRSLSTLTWENPDMRALTRYGVTTLEGGRGYLGLPPNGDSIVTTSPPSGGGTPPPVSTGGIVTTGPGSLGVINGVPNFSAWESLASSWGKATLGNNFNVKTIAADSIGPTAAALTSSLIPVPVIGGLIGTAVGALLAAIGVKGPTTHLDLTQVDQQTAAFKTAALKFYDLLPPDGQTAAGQYADNFLAAMQRDFGTWWGGMDLGAGDVPSEGLLNRRVRQAIAGGNFATPRNRYANSLGIPYGVILRGADASTVKANLQSWFFDEHLNPVFIKPLSSFVTTRLNAVLSYDSAGNITITPTAGSDVGTQVAGFLSSPITWVLGLGLLLAASRQKGRR